MAMTLAEILALVGKLDDSPSEDNPRERFRKVFLRNVEIGQIRDFVEECLRTKGDQYNRALQDLVNHVGSLMGFDVVFGRYQGVQGKVGFDGYWKSPKDFHIVVEVKTTDAYAIKTATLLNYINELISDGTIPDTERTMGLYVVGRTDPEIRQLENSIVAQKHGDRLRIISVDSLLSLAEVMGEFDIGHEDILALLRPSGPTIDPVVDLMTRLVAQSPSTVRERAVEYEELPLEPEAQPTEVAYWLSPVKSHEDESAEECIRRLVGETHIYAFGDKTPGRKHIKPGDWICFYATANGVLAHARVASVPEHKPHRKVRDPDRYPWVFGLDSVKLYLDAPVVIDAELRSRLDAFHDRDPNKHWAWFVQATRRIDRHDFDLLVR